MKQKNTFEGKAFRVLFIVLADLFIVFSVIIIGYDSVFSPEFPVSIGAFFLILLLWLNVEMVVQYFWRGKRRSRILKKYKVTQFTQHVLFEENDIKITNNVNAECYVIPYNQVVRVRRKKNLLLFFAKDYHLIAVDQSGIPFGGQNELFHSIFEKNATGSQMGYKIRGCEEKNSMRWTNELFYILFLNSITGAIAYGFWSVLKKNMAWRKKLKYIYPMLGIVEAFFIFPIMYSYLKISTHVPGSHGAYYGTLFLRTPFIYNVQCVIAGIWIVGAVWNLAKYAFQYLKFQKVLEKSVSFRLPETEKNKIMRELGMKGNVELYQNYAVTSPIVIGWRQKKIIFPVREYEEKELTTILYHELVHIRQHILEMRGQLPHGNGDLTEQKLGKSEAAVWENIRISGQNMITVSLSNNPFENEVRYGLIMPDGKLRYVYGSGMCSHAFEVGSTGTYKIYVENVSSSSITVSGDYLYN